jgi:hypothetical protein
MGDRRLTVVTAWERTPWHATQRAAWEALGRIESMKQSGLL